jgi:hypothetical protein
MGYESAQDVKIYTSVNRFQTHAVWRVPRLEISLQARNKNIIPGLYMELLSSFYAELLGL